MNVLIACEQSGRVRDAFRAEGHNAWSCDILPSSPDNQYHIQCNVLEILNRKWDMMIAFPPCTYLSRAGARWLYPKKILNDKRYQKLLESKSFFDTLLNSDIPRIAIENPTPFKVANLPKPTQIIQPYMFGEPYTKRTLLWLKNLPNLIPMCEVEPIAPWIPSNTGGAKRGQKHHKGIARTQTQSSLTFQGVANAMASQWGNLE